LISETLHDTSPNAEVAKGPDYWAEQETTFPPYRLMPMEEASTIAKSLGIVLEIHSAFDSEADKRIRRMYPPGNAASAPVESMDNAFILDYKGTMKPAIWVRTFFQHHITQPVFFHSLGYFFHYRRVFGSAPRNQEKTVAKWLAEMGYLVMKQYYSVTAWSYGYLFAWHYDEQHQSSYHDECCTWMLVEAEDSNNDLLAICASLFEEHHEEMRAVITDKTDLESYFKIHDITVEPILRKAINSLKDSRR
jgi:hypothetical protein